MGVALLVDTVHICVEVGDVRLSDGAEGDIKRLAEVTAPYEEVVGAGSDIEGEAVKLVELLLFGLDTFYEGTRFGIEDEESDMLHFVVESVGKLDIVIEFEADHIIA